MCGALTATVDNQVLDAPTGRIGSILAQNRGRGETSRVVSSLAKDPLAKRMS